MAGRTRLDELTERARRTIAAQAPLLAGAAAPAGPPAEAADQRTSQSTVASDQPTNQPAARSTTGMATVPLVPLAADPGSTGNWRVVLGLDPGTAITGYGVVVATFDGRGAETYRPLGYGVLETPAGEPMPKRLLMLHRKVADLVRAYRPSEAAVEQLFFGRNTTTAITVGQARGVLLLSLAEAGIPVSEYSPAEVKHTMAGFGRADKTQMQRMVTALLGLESIPRPDDAADALALALCHLRLSRMRSLGIR